MNNIDYFKQDIHVGDIASIELTSGKSISGKITDISNDFVLLETEAGKSMRLLDGIIGGWELITKEDIDNTDEDDDELESDGKVISINLVPITRSQLSLYHDRIVSMFRSLLSSNVKLSSPLDSNAVVSTVNDDVILATHDNGTQLLISKNSLIGYSGINDDLLQGKRLFCVSSGTPAKATRSKSNILSFSFSDLLCILDEELNKGNVTLINRLFKIIKRFPSFSKCQKELRSIKTEFLNYRATRVLIRANQSFPIEKRKEYISFVANYLKDHQADIDSQLPPLLTEIERVFGCKIPRRYLQFTIKAIQQRKEELLLNEDDADELINDIIEDRTSGFNLKEDDVAQLCKECLSLYKQIILSSNVRASQIVEHNSTIIGPSTYDVDFCVAQTQDNQTVYIRKEGFVGDPSIHLKKGALVFSILREPTSDSISTIGLMNYNTINQYYAKSINERTFIEALSVVRYLFHAKSFAKYQNSIKALLDKVYMLYKFVQNNGNLAEQDIDPAQLKSFVSFLIKKENHKKPISDQGIADACRMRFGQSVELNRAVRLREELGLADQASRQRLYQEQKIQEQSECFDDSGCYLLQDIIGHLVKDEEAIPTNAEIVVDDNNDQPQAKTDDGQAVTIQKDFYIGDPSSLQVEHTRLFVKPQDSGKCFIAIQEQTFGELFLSYNNSLFEHRYQDVISIIKALRSISRFSSVDNDLKEIYNVAKDGVRIESKKQIVDFVDLSEDERTALRTLTREMIESEDKNNPFSDYQIAGAYNSKYSIVLNVSAVGVVRSELGFASAIERKNQSLFIESNCYIDKYFIWYNNGAARNEKYPEIRFKDDVVDPELLSELESFRKGSPSIPAVCATVVEGRHISASFMVKPGTFHELTQKARAFETSGNVSTAEAIREFLSKWENNTIADSDDSAIIYGRAREMRQNREYSGSERLYGILIERNYQLDTVVKDLADMYREMNQPGKAIEIMEKHVEKMSNKLKAYNFMSSLYSTAGLYSSSIEYIEKTIQLAPSKNHHAIYYNLANLCILNKDIASAKKYIELAVKLKPTNKKYKVLLGKLTTHKGSEIVRLEKSLTFKMPSLIEYDIRSINPYEIGEEAARLLNKIKTSEESQMIEEKRNSILEYAKERYSYQLSSACVDSAQDYMLAIQSIKNTEIVSAGIAFLMTYLVSDTSSLQNNPLPTSVSSLISKYKPGTNAKLPTAMEYLLCAIDKSCLPTILKELHKDTEWGTFICRVFSLPETMDEKEFVLRSTKAIEQFQSKSDYICQTLQRISITESPHKQYKDLVGIISEHSPIFLHQSDVEEIQNLLRIIQQVDDTIKCDDFRIAEDRTKRLKEVIMSTIKGIGKRPTTLSAVYFIPVLERCSNIIDSNLSRLASVKSPSLDIISIAPARESDNKCSLILKAINKEGHAPATLTSIRITELNGVDVTSKAYNHGSRRVLYGGDDYTFEIGISLTANDLASRVLNSIKCNVIYYDKDSKEYSVDILLKPIRIDDSLHFKPYDNKFLKWADGKEVQDVSMMKGRDVLIDHIASTALEGGKNFIIYGQRRSGKSTVLYHVKEKLRSTHKCFVAKMSLLGLSADDDEEDTFLGDLYYVILSGIQDQIRIENREVYRKVFGEGLDCDIIRKNPGGKFSFYLNRIKDVIIDQLGYDNDRIILLIDEFTTLYQEILDKHISGVFVQKMKELAEAESITFVLSGHDVMPKFIEAYPNEFAIFEKKQLTCIEEKFARELIEMPVWDNESNSSRFDIAAVDYLVDITACSPFYIQILCAKIVDYANKHSISIITEYDAKTVVAELINTQTLTRGNFDNLIPARENKKFHERVYGLSMDEVSRVCHEVAQFNQEYVQRSIISSVKSSGKLKEIICYLHDRDVIDYHPQYGPEYIKIKVSLFKEWLRKNEI